MAEEEKKETKEKEKKSPKRRAEELMEVVRVGKLVATVFGQALERQYLIHGKPMQYWRDHFKITVPEDPDIAQCKMLAARLMNLLHEATFYYSASELQLDALLSGQETEYINEFNKLTAEYKEKNKSLPSQKTLETIANRGIIDLKGAIYNAKMTKNFWKRVIANLTETRKLLEIVSDGNRTQSYLDRWTGTNIPENVKDGKKYG